MSEKEKRDRSSGPADVVTQALRRMGGSPDDAHLRQAAWVARCVGRGEAAPLRPEDVTALAGVLQTRSVERGGVVFRGGDPSSGVWIVRSGRVELSVGSGLRRTVVHLLRPGDVDGDLQMLLEMPVPYTARALTDVSLLHLDSARFDLLLQQKPLLARRWLFSVAARLATSQARILSMLGHTLPEQVARLLLDEAEDGKVELTQTTIAAMLGVRRPSLNKVLKNLEQEGLLTTEYGVIVITDAARLARQTG